MKQSRGFTLIELLVVIAIIGVLSSIVLASLNTARIKARDGARRAELREIQKALEFYYDANGHYPIAGASCAMYSSEPSNGGQPYFSDGNYIPGLVPTYMGNLPRDPSGSVSTYYPCNGNWVKAFMYISNPTGTGYKLLLHCGPESAWTSSDPMYDPIRPTWAWQISGGQLNSANGDPLGCPVY